MFKQGDHVLYRTKDFHGYQWINAVVVRVNKYGVHLRTVKGNVALLVQPEVLTKVKTVWADTHKLVDEEN